MKLIKIYPNGSELVIEYPDDIAEELLKANPERFKKFEEEVAEEPDENEQDKAVNTNYKPRKSYKILKNSDES